MKRWSSIRLLLASSFALSFLSCEDVRQQDGAGGSEQVAAAQPKLTRTLDEPLTVWVVMKGDVDLTRLVSQNWIARGREVFRQLTTTAAASQAALAAYLTTRGVRFQSFWIVNALKVTADRATIAEIGRRLDVKTIIPDRSYSLPPIRPGRPQRSVQTVEWGVANVRAPDVWSTFGARGEGVVVANIDTGVQFDHPALVQPVPRQQRRAPSTTTTTGSTPARSARPAPPATTTPTAPTPWAPWSATTATPAPTRSAWPPRPRWIAAKGCGARAAPSRP